MARHIGFDVYGTLVDPLGMTGALEGVAGDRARQMSEVWRAKQLEYTFRRGLMRRYEDFDACTRQALIFAARSLDVRLDREQEETLLGKYLDLPAFPDAAPGLTRLREAGHSMVAFSNGLRTSVETLLGRSGILEYLDDVVSVDDLKTFKPAPELYLYLSRRLGVPPGEVWMVSSNAFDAIGAKSAGLRTAWVRRNPATVYDPWDVEPDLVVEDLEELASRLDGGR